MTFGNLRVKMLAVQVSVAVVSFAVFLLYCDAYCGTQMTTAEFEKVMIGRCVDYQTTKHPGVCGHAFKNCSDLWRKFSAAFVGKPPCEIKEDLFFDYLRAAGHDITGKQMFHSGIMPFAQKYSDGGNRYMTLEDTLPGYLVNGVKFCGGPSEENSSIPCPAYNDTTCKNPAFTSFWTAASVNFAQKAEGNIFVLLNASRVPLIREDSFFNKYEVPNLREGFVKNIQAIVLNVNPSKMRAPCKSLKDLQSGLKARNITLNCTENPRDLVDLYCATYGADDICRAVSTAPLPAVSNPMTCLTEAMVLIIAAFITHIG